MCVLKLIFLAKDEALYLALKNDGAGDNSSLFSISCPDGKHCDNFDGENVAITVAIDKFKHSLESNIVFPIDSQAAILSLTNSSYNNTEVYS